MKKISINLDEKTEKQLTWLINEYNRNFAGTITMTDALKISINNEFSAVNLQLIDYKEEEYCEEEWLNNYKSQ